MYLFILQDYKLVLGRGSVNYTMCVCVSCLVVLDSLRPHELEPAKLLCPWDSPGRILGWVAISFSKTIQ